MRLKKVFVLGFTCLFFQAGFQTCGAADSLILIHNGNSSYQILVGKGRKTPESARMGAQELQTYLQKVTGVRLPIVHQYEQGRKYIVVGEQAYTKELGLSLDNIKPEGFVIIAAGEDLVLMGRDTAGYALQYRTTQTGTLFAVYDFLEKFCGIRWFIPTQLGEVVPPRKTLTVPVDLNIKEEPSFTERQTRFADSKKTIFNFEKMLAFNKMEDETQRLYAECLLWYKRNKFGAGLRIATGHAWYQIMPLEKYHSRHPEYFALLSNGRRVSSYRGRSKTRGGQVCTSNPEVVAAFVAHCKAYFKRSPHAQSCSISMNDSLGFCTCERCRSLYVPEWVLLSEQLCTFYSAIGEEVYKDFPDKYLGCYAKHPSKKVKMPPNLYIYLPRNFVAHYYWLPAGQEKIYRNLRAFVDAGASNIGFYSCYYRSEVGVYPGSTRPIFAKLIPTLKELNVRGLYLYVGGGNWGGMGLDHYLLGRYMWDHTTDLNKVLDEYYITFYGAEAGGFVRKYHDVLEGAYRRLAEEKAESKRGIELITYLYGTIRKEARQTLDQALGAAHGRVKERIDLLSDSFRVVELLLDISDAKEELTKHPSPKNASAFEKVVCERYKLLQGSQDSLAIPYNSITRGETSVRARLGLADALIQKYILGKVVAMYCPPTKQAPVIDGKLGLDDACWTEAQRVSFLENDTGEPAEVMTEVMVAYDKNNFYVAFVCNEPELDKLQGSITQRDGKVWTEDELEIFLDTNCDKRSCFQFRINSLGTQYDGKKGVKRGRWDISWNASWEAKTGRNKDSWVAEFAIPFKELGLERVLPGHIWAVNFCRVRRIGDKEKSAFAPFGKFDSQESFGELMFK